MQLVSLICINWIVIHPVDSTVHLFYYCGLINKVLSMAFVSFCCRCFSCQTYLIARRKGRGLFSRGDLNGSTQITFPVAVYVIPGLLNNKCHFIVTPSKPKASMFQVGWKWNMVHGTWVQRHGKLGQRMNHYRILRNNKIKLCQNPKRKVINW